MSKRPKTTLICLLIILATSYAAWAVTRPIPALQPSLIQPAVAKTTSKLVWPAAGQSAVRILGTPVVETHNPQTPLPTASTAKMLTALLVLKAKPLEINQPGPIITLSASDVAIYNSYLAKQGSVVPVVAGEQISEYQMLQTMLLPSANNMADSLAIWAYGSLPAYASAANSYAQVLGLSNTHVGSDASGFIPDTKSTAADLTRIGEEVMQQPVLTQIVAQTSASGIPVVNTIKNINFLLNTNNVVGVKTGNTDQAGGVYVSAAKLTKNNKVFTLITANVGAPTLFDAVSGSLPLIKSAQNNIQSVNILNSKSVVGSYKAPWENKSIPATNDLTLSSLVWGGETPSVTININSLSSKSESTSAGRVISSTDLASASSPVHLVGRTSPPSVWWRLTHP